MVYKWADGSQVKGVKAQVAGSHLERLRKRHNEVLTPRIVVEDARSPASPLHPVFEWNDKRAAEKHRLEQAGYILRAVVVVTSEEQEELRTVRAFVSVIEDDARGYTSIIRAMGKQELREQVLSQALQDFRALQTKYKELAELARVFWELKKVRVKTVKKSKTRKSR